MNLDVPSFLFGICVGVWLLFAIVIIVKGLKS